jgi:hypothetical protein
MRHSHDSAAEPIGHFVDPDKLVKARQAGAPASELSERAGRDEFIPDEPYDPQRPSLSRNRDQQGGLEHVVGAEIEGRRP